MEDYERKYYDILGEMADLLNIIERYSDVVKSALEKEIDLDPEDKSGILYVIDKINDKKMIKFK